MIAVSLAGQHGHMYGSTENLRSMNYLRQVLTVENLYRAIKQVKRNKGSCGIDGMGVDELKDYFQTCWREIKSEKAVEPLISALDDKECGWMTALALGKIHSEKAVEPLINLLKNENIKVRWAALWSLGKIQSEKAAKSLIKALNRINKSSIVKLFPL